MTDIFALKILVFGLFAVLVLWLLILLKRTPAPEEGPEVYTVEDGEVQVHNLKDWREAQRNAD